jgi:hypothetical protein
MLRNAAFPSILPALVLLLSTSAAFSEDKTLGPQLHWPADTSVLDVHIETTVEVDGQAIAPSDKLVPAVYSEMMIDKEYILELTPEAPGEHEQVLRARYCRTKHRSYGKMFDTDAPSGMSFQDADRDAIGIPFDVVVDPRGSVVRVSGLEAIWNRATTQPDSEFVVPMIKSSLGDATIRQVFTLLADKLPAQSVGLNQTWKNTDTITPNALVGAVQVKETRTVSGFEHNGDVDIALIDFSSECAKTMDAATLAKSGLSSAKFEIKQHGKIRRSSATGLLVDRIVEGRTNFESGVIENGKAESHTIILNSKVTVTLNPGKYAATRPAP